MDSSAVSCDVDRIGVMGIFCDYAALPDLLRLSLPAENFFFTAGVGLPGAGLPRPFDLFCKSNVSTVGDVADVKDIYLCLGYAIPFEFRDFDAALQSHTPGQALNFESVFCKGLQELLAQLFWGLDTFCYLFLGIVSNSSMFP